VELTDDAVRQQVKPPAGHFQRHDVLNHAIALSGLTLATLSGAGTVHSETIPRKAA
jgi:hypothetical protein